MGRRDESSRWREVYSHEKELFKKIGYATAPWKGALIRTLEGCLMNNLKGCLMSPLEGCADKDFGIVPDERCQEDLQPSGALSVSLSTGRGCRT